MDNNITEQSDGIGIHWYANLKREDLGNQVVVNIAGSASGRLRTARWYVDVSLWVPATRNRQPKPHTGHYYAGPEAGQDWSQRTETVSRRVGVYEIKQQAVDVAYKFLREMDREALLDSIIESMWASEYSKDCNRYLNLGTDDKEQREARIEKIRAMRKADPEFAELFPEPPSKADY